MAGFLDILSNIPGLGGCLGVDVGASGTKVIQASGSRRAFSVKSILFQEANADLTSGKFKDSVQKKRLSNVTAAFSIADEKVESHEFKLPKLEKKELQTAIDWEIKKTITSPDFAFHDVLTFEGTEGVEVQCIVASKDVVQSRFEEAKNFGFKPGYLETESAALLAAAKVARDMKPIEKAAIVDLGHSAFRIIFVHQDRVSFTRSLYLGLGPLVQQVMTDGNLTNDQVIALFKELKTQGAGEGSHALLPVVERQMQESLYTLCEEFRRSEFFAKDQKSLEEVEDIFLTGGGACIPYAVQYIQNHLTEKKISTLDPFAWMKTIPEGMDPASGPLWACAVGLSLRNVV
jgi:type IV pilus assembly protein PilM